MPPRRTSRDQVLSQPRSGARPLGGSPGPSRPAGQQQPPPTYTARTVPRRGNRAGTQGRPGGRSSGRPAAGPASPAGSSSTTTSTRPTTARAGGSAQTAGRARAAPAGGSRQRQRNLPGLPHSTRRSGDPGKVPAYHNYQAIILAEFVAAELLVAATPIATKKNKAGLSPYVPRDLVKLIALGLVYFILQLIASGGRGGGRISAWFGALILLAVGLNEASDLAKVFDVLSGGAGKTKTTAVTTAADTLTSFVPPTVGGTAGSPGGSGSSPSPSSGRRQMSSGGGQPPAMA